MKKTLLALFLTLPIFSAPLVFAATQNASTLQNAPTALSLAKDSVLNAALYKAYAERPEGRIKFDAQTGAVGVNIEAATDASKKWFIEQQAYGGDLVQAGVVRGDAHTVDLGFKIFDYGFAKQGENGAFTGTGDDFHSTSFFLEAVSRSLLLLREANFAGADARSALYTLKLENAARWMLGPILPTGDRRNAPYTHRRFLVAAGWMNLAKLSSDPELRARLISEAAKRIDDGLAQRKTDGTMPEKDGYDANYQAVSALFMARLLATELAEPQRAAILAALPHVLSRSAQSVGETGEVDLSDSSRTATEAGRSGAAKKLDHRSWAQAYVFGGKITGDATHRETAKKVLTQRGWLNANFVDKP